MADFELGILIGFALGMMNIIGAGLLAYGLTHRP